MYAGLRTIPSLGTGHPRRKSQRSTIGQVCSAANLCPQTRHDVINLRQRRYSFQTIKPSIRCRHAYTDAHYDYLNVCWARPRPRQRRRRRRRPSTLNSRPPVNGFAVSLAHAVSRHIISHIFSLACRSWCRFFSNHRNTTGSTNRRAIHDAITADAFPLPHQQTHSDHPQDANAVSRLLFVRVLRLQPITNGNAPGPGQASTTGLEALPTQTRHRPVGCSRSTLRRFELELAGVAPPKTTKLWVESYVAS